MHNLELRYDPILHEESAKENFRYSPARKLEPVAEKEKFKFDVVRDQPERDLLLEKIYRLRYQVYVKEWGFEDAADHPEGLERDGYDKQSIHFFAGAGQQNDVIGTVRIIEPTGCELPIQRFFEIDDKIINDSRFKAAEISRLAISKDYRRRAIDRALFNQDNTHAQDLKAHRDSLKSIEKERRRYEHEIIQGMYLMIYAESVKLGLTHWYAVMAKGLFVVLKRWGIEFTRIGPEKEYHGLRAPYLISIVELERTLTEKNPELIKLARQRVVL